MCLDNNEFVSDEQEKGESTVQYVLKHAHSSKITALYTFIL